MRAVILERQAPIATRPLRLVERAAPEPGPGELRVRVEASAACRTDLHVIEGELPLVRAPLVPGHQVVGTVDRLGEGATRLPLGARVGIAWLAGTCGLCAACRRGAENLCPYSRYTGWHVDGGYAEAVVAHQDYVYRLDEEDDPVATAPLLCAGIIGYRALARSAVPPGGRLGMIGFGSSAHVTLPVALGRGMEVYVWTRGAAHQAFARARGAAWAGAVGDAAPALVDGLIVFAPAGEVVPPALRAVRPGGTVVLAGIHVSTLPAMDYAPHLFHEKVLTSVEANTRDDGAALLGEARAAGLRPATTVFPLDAANDVLICLRRGELDGTAVFVP